MFVINSYIAFQPSVSVEYPPLPGMTTNSTIITTASYGNGTYIASGSSELSASYRAFYAFDKTNPLSLIGWIAKSAAYNTSTGVYAAAVLSITAVVSTGNVNGEFLQLQIPSFIQITSYSITSGPESAPASNRTPRNWLLVASTDGTTWIQIDARTDQSFTTNNQTLSYTISGTGLYNYYRLIVQSIQPLNDGLCQIGELKLICPTIFNEYPPLALTGSSTPITTSSYGNGSYNITSSDISPNGGEPFKIFNKLNIVPSDSWFTNASKYNTTTGLGIGASLTISSTARTGEWISLQVPSAIILNSYTITATMDVLARSPRTWFIAGSNNGTTWTFIDTQTNISWTLGQSKSFNVSPGVAYLYYLIQITQNQTGDSMVQVGELRFFGY